MAVTIQKEKSRLYLIGDTYPIKDKIKQMGGHWDADRKAWWVGAAKASEAESLVSASSSSTAQPVAKKIGDDSKVVARVKYKGRTYYALWMGRCQSGTEKAHLTVLDGSIDFWVDLPLCEVLKRYEPREVRNGFYGRGTHTEYTTLGSIRRFVEEKKEAEKTGDICAECGRPGRHDLVQDLEDGLMKHRRCCDIEP